MDSVDFHQAPFRFAGHETFPLRLLWLKKAYNAVAEDNERRIFQDPSAIARFGVGKNMALAMRHWALAADVITDDGVELKTTPFGRTIFDDQVGLDPYIEHPSTLWLIHARLAGSAEITTFYYGFNILNQLSFSREDLAEALMDASNRRSGRATQETIKRDVEVFVRSYAPRSSEFGEDNSEPLLAELGLMREIRPSGHFDFARGSKETLVDGVFVLALIGFWKRWHRHSPTLSVELATYGAGSPGRVFKLDEDSIVTRLMRIAEITDGVIVWTDTAGLRQVTLTGHLDSIDEARLIKRSYMPEPRS
ncbi:DUF4007 family protein [Agrobacterium rhizogenes]|nr:DUF4007 family protein [Rhizobium rhizogenes]